MNIEIKSIGYKIGTVGYLSSSLADGTLRIEEGKIKGCGNHGLWLAGSRDEFLGGFNRYQLRIDEYEHADKYDTVEGSELDAIWTHAAREKLLEIAQKWCDEQNTVRENDAA